MNSPAIAAVGLGGNVGDSARVLGQAFEALAGLPQTRLLATSALYRTPATNSPSTPVGCSGTRRPLQTTEWRDPVRPLTLT